MTGRQPNEALARLLYEARWETNRQFAAAVNRVGAEMGLTLHYDGSAVTHWLKGITPQKKARLAVLEALSRRLGRPVTSAEAGFAAPLLVEPEAPDDSTTDPFESLIDTGRADMDPSRRAVLATSLYAAALPVPVYADLTKRLHHQSAGRLSRIGAGEVATVRTMTERIADILDELGGAHARPMAAAFLVNSVAPWLKAGASEAVRSDMLSAASDLVYLTGWIAMFEKEHGLGQRYYVKALELAAAAQDHITYCRTLRGMALQAANLKHSRKALELADSAAEAAPTAGPRLRAFLTGQQAHGSALVKDRRQAFARLADTEGALSKADNRRDAVGGYDQAAYHFHVSSVLYALGDVPGSVKAMRESNRVRPPVERQGRAHANGLLAQRQLEMGHLEAACATWNTFLDDYERLSSARADEHFSTMRRCLRPHRANRHVRDLTGRAQEIVRRKVLA
ncbi:regulatory protein [Streptomyces bingchenggensis BCW-1]|uniref:Regulatory protein n=1 Tax=Streptomyces bingchenggensis (strain BCW-1) TaxID=749414 RepID=D7CAV8_STRBB|nr:MULTISPECIES: hypothetical protein [Streptomyces]ADI08675.1 regulatory protein [Streptomyces bingchenggensis BCW-1]